MLSEVDSIAVVGCGLMGSSIAKTLGATGMNVAAWNRTSDAANNLAAFGVTPESSLENTVRSYDCIVAVLSNYEICRALLSPLQAQLRGKVVVNLTSGTCEEADSFGAWMREADVHYLDGSIWALPQGIGQKNTCLAYSGAGSAWERSKKFLAQLGGASKYVGERFGAANALEAAFPGTFYMTAILSFIEGIALCKAYEISDETVIDAVAPTMDLLQGSILQTIHKITAGDFITSQATLQVYLDAVKSYIHNHHSPVKGSALTIALHRTLDQACSSGLSQQDVAATICHWIKPG